MAPQRDAANAVIVDLLERFEEVDEHDVDQLVDLLGLVGVSRRRRAGLRHS